MEENTMVEFEEFEVEDTENEDCTQDTSKSNFGPFILGAITAGASALAISKFRKWRAKKKAEDVVDEDGVVDVEATPVTEEEPAKKTTKKTVKKEETEE